MAVTPDVQASDVIHYRVGNSYKRRSYHLSTTTADTFPSGIKGIKNVWWIGDTASDFCLCTFNGVTGVITFNVQSGTATGSILIESVA